MLIYSLKVTWPGQDALGHARATAGLMSNCPSSCGPLCCAGIAEAQEPLQSAAAPSATRPLHGGVRPRARGAAAGPRIAGGQVGRPQRGAPKQGAGPPVDGKERGWPAGRRESQGGKPIARGITEGGWGFQAWRRGAGQGRRQRIALCNWARWGAAPGGPGVAYETKTSHATVGRHGKGSGSNTRVKGWSKRGTSSAGRRRGAGQAGARRRGVARAGSARGAGARGAGARAAGEPSARGVETNAARGRPPRRSGPPLAKCPLRAGRGRPRRGAGGRFFLRGNRNGAPAGRRAGGRRGGARPGRVRGLAPAARGV